MLRCYGFCDLGILDPKAKGLGCQMPIMLAHTPDILGYRAVNMMGFWEVSGLILCSPGGCLQRPGDWQDASGPGTCKNC